MSFLLCKKRRVEYEGKIRIMKIVNLKRNALISFVVSFVMLLSIIPMNLFAEEDGVARINEEIKTNVQYDVYASVYDFGARVDKIVMEMPEEVSASSIDTTTFKVESANESTIGLEVVNGERKVSNVIVSDKEDGSKKETGNFVVVELETELSTKYAEVLEWNEPDFTNVPLVVNYTITQNNTVKTADDVDANFTFEQRDFFQVDVDKFGDGKAKSGIHYRDYKPKKDDKKHPLIIWLHGAGEGGENNVTHINGNRGAVAFVSDEAQKAFDNPYVLAPQSPDYWMPELVLGDLVLTGTDNTANVVDLIKEYIENNPGIDASRVYIGGCSMGGYQTWETLFAAPELFAAAFPICAAYEVPKAKLDTVKDIPIWMVHAENDDTIPVKYSRDAYQYLKDNDANVIYTEYKNVEVKGEDFAPHASWIYPLNNDPKNEDGVSFYDWMASQKKGEVKEEKTDTTLYIVIGVAALVLVAGVLVVKNKKK